MQFKQALFQAAPRFRWFLNIDAHDTPPLTTSNDCQALMLVPFSFVRTTRMVDANNDDRLVNKINAPIQSPIEAGSARDGGRAPCKSGAQLVRNGGSNHGVLTSAARNELRAGEPGSKLCHQ